MKTPRMQLAQIIASGTLNGTFGRDEIASLAAYLLDEGRVSELGPLLRDVQKVWASRGTVEVIMYSAHDVPDSAKTEIEALARVVYPSADRIVISPKIDQSLIGGIRIELADYQYDRTTKGQLQKFKALAFQGKE